MRVPTRHRSTGLDFQMTPLIDIVFLLIVFFVVSSHLARQETQLQLDLPQASTGQRPQVDENRRLVVNVLPDGTLRVAGREVAPDQLRQIIDYERQTARERLEVRVRSDQEVPYGLVEPILLACARSGVWNVSFAVVRGEALVP